jgi:6,7-dimethyl-8-ribityllumazine synthase
MSESIEKSKGYKPDTIPSAASMRIGIVVSEWNTDITSALLDGAYKALKENNIDENNIILKYVPGSFELPLGAQFLFEHEEVDSVVCLGCVIQGETRHFEFICSAVAHGITKTGLDYNKPAIFGVLTTDNIEQAADRSGGKHGNKGYEAALSAIKMVDLQKSLEG